LVHLGQVFVNRDEVGVDGDISDFPAVGGTRLLEAKLAAPRIPAEFVVRPRVSKLFEVGASKPLTLVSAGPGWGKTMAAAAWAASRGAGNPAAWVSLDEGDNHEPLFWLYVLAALSRIGAIPSDSPLAGLAPGPTVDEQVLHRIVYGLGQLPTETVLVLDDFEDIQDPAVLRGLNSLLKHPPPKLHLVLVTRVDPVLSIHRLRLSGEVVEIRAAELAFSPQEAAALLAGHNVNVGSSLEQLLERTEGWAAGLRLAGLALQADSSAARIEQLASDDRVAAGYLASEVLAAHTAELRAFLLHTCVVETLTGDLADTLTGGRKGEQHLDQLERSNAFVVSLSTSSRAYRYHPMLRGMLQQELAIREPDAVPELHRRASLWFARNDQLLLAMRHAAAAADWQLLGRLLVTRAAPRILSVERQALGAILELIPDDAGVGSLLELCRAVRVVGKGRFAPLGPHVARAWQSLADVEQELQPATRVLLHLLAATEARLAGDARTMVVQTTTALDLLEGDAATVPAAEEYTVIALNNYGTGLLWCDEHNAAEGALAEALAAPDAQRIELARINALGHLGIAHATRGSLHNASKYGEAGVNLADLRGWNNLEQAAAPYLALALVKFHQNAMDDADRFCQRGMAAVGADPLLATALRITRARINTARGRVAYAGDELNELRHPRAEWPLPELLRRWLVIAEAELQLAGGHLSTVVEGLIVHDARTPTTDQERVCLARALFLKGELDKAVQTVIPLLDHALDRGALVEAWIVTALAADRKRDDHRATTAAERALTIAHDEGIRRPFALFDLERTSRLLTQVIRLAPTNGSAASEILAAARGTQQHPDGMAEHLTDRELTVLEYLPTMLSNAEIAEKMYVSVNTVKAHLKTLYRKLDVSSRREAVQRARTLSVLPGHHRDGEPPDIWDR
jgi:LuxR family transcriptional regulator, maltose regulon positive regulatory protein